MHVLYAHLKAIALPVAEVVRLVLLAFGLGGTRRFGAHRTHQLALLVAPAALRVTHVSAVLLFLPTALGVHAALLRNRL